MNLRKGITYIAIGYLITYININLSFRTGSLNILPDFVGWILLYLGVGMLGKYTSDKPILKRLSIIAIVFSAVEWILAIVAGQLDLSYVSAFINLVEMIFTFILFTALEDVAKDYHSNRRSTIASLKIINLIVHIIMIVMSIILRIRLNNNTAILAFILAAAAVVYAVMVIVVLFGLRKDIDAYVEF